MPVPHPVSRPAASWRGVPTGLVLTYRPGENCACPGCGRHHWHVGRAYAECAFCGTALPLDLNGRSLAAQAEAPVTPPSPAPRFGWLMGRALPRMARRPLAG